MKTNRLFILLAVALVAVGCNSFNRYTLPDDSYRRLANQRMGDGVPPEYREAMLSDKEVLPPATKLCPLYRPPTLPAVPELPFRELAALSRDDSEAFDRIQQKHIEDLRLYISEVAKATRKANKEYLKACGIDVPPK